MPSLDLKRCLTQIQQRCYTVSDNADFYDIKKHRYALVLLDVPHGFLKAFQFSLSHNRLALKKTPKGNTALGEKGIERHILSVKFPIEIEKMEKKRGEVNPCLLFCGR